MSEINFRNLINCDAASYGTKELGFISFFKLFFFETGFFITVIYRVQRYLLKYESITKLLIKFLEILVRTTTSCYISYRSQIAGGVFFPHPTGIVIGEGVVIEQGVTIYQNVTFGQKENEYPIINSNVTVYPGVVVIGGISIGDNATLGPNTVVFENVERNTTIVGSRPRVVSNKESKIES